MGFGGSKSRDSRRSSTTNGRVGLSRGIVCYGDSGAPTFFYDHSLAGRSRERVVAVGSDGGFVCYSRDDRARVDTSTAQDWIRETIADVLQR